MSEEVAEAPVEAPKTVAAILTAHNETIANLCEALANLSDRIDRLERAYDRQILTDQAVRKIVSIQ